MYVNATQVKDFYCMSWFVHNDLFLYTAFTKYEEANNKHYGSQLALVRNFCKL